MRRTAAALSICFLSSGAAETREEVYMRDAWQTVNRTCSAGHCELHSNSTVAATTSTDCAARLIMYELGLQLIPALSPQRESFDALELEKCGIKPPSFSRPELQLAVTDGTKFYVDYKSGSDTNAGTQAAPFKTIAKGVSSARGAPSPKSIILQAGTHFLTDTITLGPQDSGLTITANPSAKSGDVWVSGGVPLSPTWTKVADNNGLDIWVTDVTEDIGATLKGLNTLEPVVGHDLDNNFGRLTKARYPNGDPELCTSCWKSEDLIEDWHGKVIKQYKTIFLKEFSSVICLHAFGSRR